MMVANATANTCDSLSKDHKSALQDAIIYQQFERVKQLLDCNNSQSDADSQLINTAQLFVGLRDISQPAPDIQAETLLAHLDDDTHSELLAISIYLLADYYLQTDQYKQALSLTHLLSEDLLPSTEPDYIAWVKLALADIHYKIGFFQSVRDLLSPLLSSEDPDIQLRAALLLWFTPKDASQLDDVITILNNHQPVLDNQPLEAQVLSVKARQAIEDNQPELAERYLGQAIDLVEQSGATSMLASLRLYQAKLSSPDTRMSVIKKIQALPIERFNSAQKMALATLIAQQAQLQQDWERAAKQLQLVHSLNEIVSRNKALAREYASYKLIEQAKELESAEQQAALRELEIQQQSQQQIIYGLALLIALLFIVILSLLFVRKRRDALRFEHLANTDGLTKVLNRRAVQAYAEHIHTKFKREGRPFIIALADIDHFKAINDNYGHDVGDVVLTTFAERAKQLIRGGDAIGRWGGEEWLFVLPGTDLANVQGLFERLRHGVADINAEPHQLKVTFSMGAVKAEDGLTVSQMISKADELLYRAKHNGRNQLVI